MSNLGSSHPRVPRDRDENFEPEAPADSSSVIRRGQFIESVSITNPIKVQEPADGGKNDATPRATNAIDPNLLDPSTTPQQPSSQPTTAMQVRQKRSSSNLNPSLPSSPTRKRRSPSPSLPPTPLSDTGNPTYHPTSDTVFPSDSISVKDFPSTSRATKSTLFSIDDDNSSSKHSSSFTERLRRIDEGREKEMKEYLTTTKSTRLAGANKTRAWLESETLAGLVRSSEDEEQARLREVEVRCLEENRGSSQQEKQLQRRPSQISGGGFTSEESHTNEGKKIKMKDRMAGKPAAKASASASSRSKSRSVSFGTVRGKMTRKGSYTDDSQLGDDEAERDAGENDDQDESDEKEVSGENTTNSPPGSVSPSELEIPLVAAATDDYKHLRKGMPGYFDPNIKAKK